MNDQISQRIDDSRSASSDLLERHHKINEDGNSPNDYDGSSPNHDAKRV